jgi:hypothetical protein
MQRVGFVSLRRKVSYYFLRDSLAAIAQGTSASTNKFFYEKEQLSRHWRTRESESIQ